MASPLAMKLLLIWKGPLSKKNYFVASLEKVPAGYIFYYNKNGVDNASNEGFSPFVGLSEIDMKYESSKLFSIFERRIPHKQRLQFIKILQDKKIKQSDDPSWDYLRITKGRLATDSLIFLEPIFLNKNNFAVLTCEIAGWTFTKKNNRILLPNDHLTPRKALNNPHDKYAIELLDPNNNNQLTGYVPHPYNLFFYKILSMNYAKVHAFVISSNGENRPTVALIVPLSKSDFHLFEDFSSIVQIQKSNPRQP